MKLASQPTKFADLSNLSEHSTDNKNTQYLVRRKSEVDFSTKKRPPSSQPQNKSRVCFIPMAKIERNPSQLFCQTIPGTITPKTPKEVDKDCSFDGSVRRFARNTQKNFKKASPDHQCSKESEGVKECCSENCRNQKYEMGVKIDRLLAINQHLSRQTDRLNGLLSKINSKVSELSDDLEEKTLKIEQLSKLTQNREMGNLQLQDILAGKDRLILRLQENIKTLEKQKTPLSCKVNSVDNSQCAEIIHELNQKLKYKEIQSYLLKKERLAHQDLQREHKSVLKENIQLRQRLSYYLRLKEKQERNGFLKDSVSSLSLSMTSACSERFSFGVFDGHLHDEQGIELINREGSEIRGSNF